MTASSVQSVEPGFARTSLVTRSTHPHSPCVSDADMAWLLAEAAQACLADYERTIMFVELGSGEHHLAIERNLRAVVSSGTVLSETTLSTLTHWLDGYAGSTEEPRLRTMLAEARSHRFGPVPLRTEPRRHRCIGRRRHA